MTTFTKANAAVIHADFQAMIQAFAAKHKLTISAQSRGRFDPHGMYVAPKVTFKTADATPTWAETYGLAKFGLKPEDIGRVIMHPTAGRFILKGVKSNRPKFPLLLQDGQGRMRKATADFTKYIVR